MIFHCKAGYPALFLYHENSIQWYYEKHDAGRGSARRADGFRRAAIERPDLYCPQKSGTGQEMD